MFLTECKIKNEDAYVNMYTYLKNIYGKYVNF